MPVEGIELNPDLSYDEEPIEILAPDSKILRDRTIELVRVMWRHRGVEEAIWERKDDIREQHPYLFPPVVVGFVLCVGLNFLIDVDIVVIVVIMIHGYEWYGVGKRNEILALRGAFLKPCNGLERSIPQALLRP
ncbi:hypothetical protein GQ457_01G013960 [Hibiscus cannabinus]